MFKYYLYSIAIQLTVIGSFSLLEQLVLYKKSPSYNVQARDITVNQQPMTLLDVLELPSQNDNVAERNVSAVKERDSSRSVSIRGRLSDLLLDIEYPVMARRLGMEGRVVVWISVAEDGSLNEVRLVKSSGHALLDQSALKGVSAWSFAPGTAIELKVPVVFRLK